MRVIGHQQMACLSCGTPGEPDDTGNFIACANYNCEGNTAAQKLYRYCDADCFFLKFQNTRFRPKLKCVALNSLRPVQSKETIYKLKTRIIKIGR